MERKLKKIREEFEVKKISVELLQDLYKKYNPDVEVTTFISQAVELFPKLNCGIASVYLQHLFGGQIIQGRYGDNDHTFLMLDDQVIDITADQYGGPKVYVGKLKLPWALK